MAYVSMGVPYEQYPKGILSTATSSEDVPVLCLAVSVTV